MSITYDGLKEVQEVRQSKYSQALKKSTLEKTTIGDPASALTAIPKIQPRSSQAKSWDPKWTIGAVIALILVAGIALYFILNGPFAKNNKILTKAKTRTVVIHKMIRHKIIKKKKHISPDD